MWTANRRAFSTLGRVPPPKGPRRLYPFLVLLAPVSYGLYKYYGEEKKVELVQEKKIQEAKIKPKSEVKPEKSIKEMLEELEKQDQEKKNQVRIESEKEEKAEVIPEPVKEEVIEKILIVNIPEPVSIIPEPVKEKPEVKVDFPEKPSESTENPSEPTEKPSESTEKPSEPTESPLEPSQTIPESAIPAELPPQDLTSVINDLKSELLVEQAKRESELFDKLESSFVTMINEYSPKFLTNKSSPAKVLAEQIDFSKSTVEELQKKYESLIFAYEDRLETLGVKNYDNFIQRLRIQKKKWKERMVIAHNEYEAELQKRLEERDAQWNQFLILEQEDAEQHFEQQGSLDKQFAVQETELKMTMDFEGKLEEITRGLSEATNIRLQQLEEITEKIRDMELIIMKLKDIHKVHLSIENLQRTLTADKGNLTHDLEVVVNESKHDEVIKSALFKIDPLYHDMISKGIPKMKQIQTRFEHASERARRAALIKSKSFFNVIGSYVAVKLIPKNIKTIDDADTYSILKQAEDALIKEDLRETLSQIDRLTGYPKEEMENVAHDITIRLALLDLIEVLTGYTVSAVQKVLTSRNY